MTTWFKLLQLLLGIWGLKSILIYLSIKSMEIFISRHLKSAQNKKNKNKKPTKLKNLEM